MDNDMTQICHRILYLFNVAHQEDPVFLNPVDYPTDPIELRNLVDYSINNVNYSNLSESFKQIWMTDKFSYVTWIRDTLSK